MNMERTEITKHGVKLRVNKPPVTAERLRTFEADLGYPLPNEYREFLLLYNGGHPEQSVFRLPDGAEAAVHWFYSLYEGTVSSLTRSLKSLRERIPPATLPIANDGLGNQVLLGLAGDVGGKVYFWDHELEPETQPDWSNVVLIADSFPAFMHGLRTP
jgi:cell wall assembly regulator SMI1